MSGYRAMWHAYESAATRPNPDDPQLARYAAGTALHTLTNGLTMLREHGLKGTGSVAHTPEPTIAFPVHAPTEVVVSDCMDTAVSHLARTRSGPAYADSPGGHRLCLATVQRRPDGSWKVVTFAVRAVGTC
jgi:hypothetical protein